MSRFELLVWLFARLALLSPLAFGAGIAVSPDLHRLLVDQMGLLTHMQFAGAVALGQAAPGPNVIYIPLLGYQLAGLAGAFVGLAGFLLPTSLMVLTVARLGQVHAQRLSVRAIRVGLPPMTIGLLMAAGWVIAPDSDEWRYLAISVAGALVMWLTRVHLLWLIVAGGIAGAMLQ